jgi:endonuclease/exonuclease/phosphatase (EEP) superfamily protein YafD
MEKKRWFRKVVNGLAWAYGFAILLWLILYIQFGDELWWLALVNAVTPILFAPLLPLLCLGLAWRRSTLLAPALPVLLIFLVFYGERFPLYPVGASVQPEAEISLLTFNIWAGSRTLDTASVIADNGWPDILALQELTAFMANALDDFTDEEYPFRLLSSGEGSFGLGIYSRYPLTELDASSLYDMGWQVQLAEVQVEERSLLLYNVHAGATNLVHRQGVELSLPESVRLSYGQRREFARKLNEDIAQRGQPAIIAGDFNSTDRSDVYKILTQNLVDSHRAAGWGFGHTFPVLSDSYREVPLLAKLLPANYNERQVTPSPLHNVASLPFMRIDMIMHTPDFATISSWVSPTHGESDHLPVGVRLRWRE